MSKLIDQRIHKCKHYMSDHINRIVNYAVHELEQVGVPQNCLKMGACLCNIKQTITQNV